MKPGDLVELKGQERAFLSWIGSRRDYSFVGVYIGRAPDYCTFHLILCDGRTQIVARHMLEELT